MNLWREHSMLPKSKQYSQVHIQATHHRPVCQAPEFNYTILRNGCQWFVCAFAFLTVWLSSETLSRKQSDGHSSIPRFRFGNDMLKLIRIERLVDFGIPTPRLTPTTLHAARWQTFQKNSKSRIEKNTTIFFALFTTSKLEWLNHFVWEFIHNYNWKNGIQFKFFITVRRT